MSSEVLYRYKAVLPIKGTVRGQQNTMPTFSKLIEGFSYKPGYEFTLVHPEAAMIEDHDGSMLGFGGTPMSVLYLKAYISDSTKPPHDPFLLQFQAAVPHFVETMDSYRQREYLREILRVFEQHEIDEWYRVDGELVHNPHAEGR